MNQIDCRIVQKTDTEANWKTSKLIPYKGEIILYETSDADVPFGVKIGDGEQNPDSLPFIDDPLATKEYVNTMVEDRAPVRGVDYWTEEDKNEIKSYVEEAILNGAW